MTLPQPFAIDAAESDYLYVEASHIAGAGLGLFTAIPLHRGEVVALYHGERISAKLAEGRARRGEDAYFVMLHDGRTLDGMHRACFAKYANDVEGPGTSRLKNNAVITLDEEDRPCLMALRTIGVGQEIFVGYGKAYWKGRSQ